MGAGVTLGLYYQKSPNMGDSSQKLEPWNTLHDLQAVGWVW